MDLVLAFIVGIASAVAYSFIQAIFVYFRWRKTKLYFTSGIYGAIASISYHVSNILDIDLIRIEYGEEILLEDEEFLEEVRLTVITKKQYAILNRMLQKTSEKIQTLRKEALSIPIFAASDFHSVDGFLLQLNSFLSFYSWLEDGDFDEETDNRLKEKLCGIITNSKRSPFQKNLLDDLWTWYNRKYFYIKNHLNKHKGKRKRYGDIDTDLLPF